MTEQNIARTACPNCSTSYKLAAPDLIGKTVTCKRCGTRFEATPGNHRRTYPLIGKLAIRYGLIGQDQLESALAYQAAHSASSPEMDLRDIFLEKGFINDQQRNMLHLVEKYWQVSQLGKGFCRLALARNLISKEDAREVVRSQSERFKRHKTIHRIADLLVETGKITPAQRDTVLELQGRLGRTAAIGEKKKAAEVTPAPPADPVSPLFEPPSSAEALWTEETLPMTGAGNRFGPEATQPMAGAGNRFEPEETQPMAGAGNRLEPEETQPRAGAGNRLEPEETQPRAGAGNRLELVVAEDGMTATLQPVEGGAATNTLEYVQNLLANAGITTGILADERIVSYLKTDALYGKPLQVARGTPPEPGADAKLTHHYETHQQVGKVLAGGNIDYRERGEIPHVKKGDLLIEKTPLKPSQPGLDIFGHSISAPPTADVKLRSGAGTMVSEDGLQLIALIDGQPKMTFGGRLSVLSELKIDGDVDLKTGHINFEGHIVVTGCVQSGFRVRGHSLTAKEITGAQVRVTGDVTVTGGIIGADINCQGNIEARYIKNSRVSAFGDIRVSKEITDSTIETSGACRVETGKIITSTLSAKQGIHCKEMGTDVSSPCRLAVGVDAHIERELQGIQDAIARRNTKLDQLKARRTAVDIDKQSLDQRLIQLAQVQDRSLVEQREVQEGLEHLKNSAPAEAVQDAENRIEELGQRARDAEATLTELFDTQDEIDRKLANLEDQIRPLRDEIEELLDEKRGIEEWAKNCKSVAAVSVSGPIYVGTIVAGVHTQLRLADTCRHVRIQEVKITDPDATSDWEMRINPFR